LNKLYLEALMSEFLIRFFQSLLSIFSGGQQVVLPIPTPEEEPEVEEPIIIEPISFEIDDSWLITTGIAGHAVSSSGWTHTDGKPTSITWHWTATWDRDLCDRLLGGADALRKPVWNEDKQKWDGGASVHYCVGRTHDEGISQYVKLEHRSWHAGAGQTVRWDGQDISGHTKWLSGARASVGIETVEVGFARDNIPKESDWIQCFGTGGKFKMWLQPWTEEQIDMMIFVGKKIVEKYPNIKYIDHHGHMDICPGVKEDPALAFPFARVLSGIYDEEIPDVWSPFMLIAPRQRALELLGYEFGDAGVDGDWGRISDAALTQFQRDRGLHDNGQWSTFVCWDIYFALLDAGFNLEDVA